MLPSLRTILAAMFVTAIPATLVGTALMPIFPRVEQPLARQARTEKPNEQSRLLGDADEFHRPHSAEPPGSETINNGTSRHTKLVIATEHPAEGEARGAASVLASQRPPANSNTQSVDVADTGSVNTPSTATDEPAAPVKGSAASLAGAPKRGSDRCVFCHRASRAHGLRYRSHVWRRVRMSPDRNTFF